MNTFSLVLACFICTGRGQRRQSYLDCLQSGVSADSCKTLKAVSSATRSHPLAGISQWSGGDRTTQSFTPSKAAALLFLSLDPRAAFQASGLGRSAVTALWRLQAGAPHSSPRMQWPDDLPPGTQVFGSASEAVKEKFFADLQEPDGQKWRESLAAGNVSERELWTNAREKGGRYFRNFWKEEQKAEYEELLREQEKAHPREEVEEQSIDFQVMGKIKRKQRKSEKARFNGWTPEDSTMQIGRVFLDACNLGLSLQIQPNGPPKVATESQIPGLSLLLAIAAPDDAPISIFFDGKHPYQVAGSEWTYRDKYDEREHHVVFTEGFETADDVLMRHLHNVTGSSFPVPISHTEAIELYETRELPKPVLIAKRGRRKKTLPFRAKREQFLRNQCRLWDKTGNIAAYTALTDFTRGHTLGTIKGLVNLAEEHTIDFERCRGPLTLVITDDKPLARRCLKMKPPAVVLGRKDLIKIMKTFTDDHADLSAYANEDDEFDEESYEDFNAEFDEEFDDDSDDDVVGLSEDYETEAASPQQEEEEEEEPKDFAALMLARERRRQKALA